jgi:hypothetical protein
LPTPVGATTGWDAVVPLDPTVAGPPQATNE